MRHLVIKPSPATTGVAKQDPERRFALLLGHKGGSFGVIRRRLSISAVTVPPVFEESRVVKVVNPAARHVMCASLETVQDCTTMRAFRGHTVRLIGTMG